MAEDIRKLARLLAEHDRRLRNLAASSQLANSSIEDGSLDEYDADGNLGTSLGKQHDGTHNVISHTGPVPPQPVAPSATITAGVMSVRWNGKFAGDALSPMDFMHCSVHISATSPFVASIDNQKATISGETGDLATIALDAGTWYVCLVAKSLSGKWSAQSATVEAIVPLPADMDVVQQKIDELQAELNDLLAMANQLDTRLDQAGVDLAAHEGRLSQAEIDLNELTTVTLPALQTDLDNAKASLATLNTTTLPQLQSDLDAAEASLATLTGTTLPNLQTQLNTTNNTLNTLKDTTVPAMQAEVDQAQADLTTAFGQISTVDTKATNAQTAAANAQTAADNAVASANAQIAQIIARGQNLVRNGDFELYPEGWPFKTSTGVEISTAQARSGSKSLQLGPSASNSYAESDYVPTSGSRTYYLEMWAKRVAGTPAEGNNVGFVYRRQLASGTTAVNATGSFPVSSLSDTTWTKVSTTVTIPSTDVLSIRFGPWWQSPSGGSGTGVYVDDVLAFDVTEAKAALDAAAAAQSTANAAQTAAGTAQAAADGAMTMATSKSRVYYSTSVATGTAEKAGDLWRQRNGTYEVIAEWMWTGSAWQKVTVSGSNVSNMDVGYLTSGGALIQTAVIQKIASQAATIIELNADRITAGQLGSARINVTELAASIATIIQLNADRIVSGTIATARLNASEIAAAVATIIQLNADRIVSGTIATARLNASEIAAAVATIIQLNADRITSGIINTARLNTTEIAAQTAAIQTVDVKNLFVTTGTFTEAVINRLFVDLFAAKKITTQMLAVGDFQNLLATGLNNDDTATDWAAGLTPDFTDKPAGLSHSFKSAVGAGSKPSTSSYYDVQPGDEFEFVVWVKASLPNSRLYIEMRDQSGAHAMVSTRIDDTDLFWGNSAYPVSAAPVPTTWTKWRARMVPNANARRVRIGTIYFNHTSGTETGAQVWLAGMSVKKRFGGEVLIDGSVVAKHLSVNAIDATGNISGNAFVGRSFTGGTFTGATFQTDTAADLGLKITSTGMQVFGPEGGEPVTEIRANGGTTYAVTDPVTGDTLASLDANGNITGTGLNLSGEALFNGVPIVGGTDFEAFSTDYGNGLMDYLPRGMVVRGYRDSRGFSATNREGEILELSYDNLINRGYRIHVTPFMADVAADTTGVLRIYHTRDGSRPTMSSPVLHAQFFRNRSSVTMGAPFGGVFYDLGGSGKVRYLFTFRGEGGQMLFTTASPGGQFRAWVEDIGYAPPETGISRTGARDLEAAAPPAPAEPEPENYTQTWSPTGYRSYDGSSTYSYATGSNRMYQGDGPYAGMLTSIAIFGNGSKGQSITSALSGATVTSVKVKMTFPHWWYGSGGTAQLMLHGVTSLPSTKPTLTYATSKSGIPRGGTVTFSVPSSFWAGIKSGTYDGVGLGNGTSGLTYYGYAKASSIRLEIKYTK